MRRDRRALHALAKAAPASREPTREELAAANERDRSNGGLLGDLNASQLRRERNRAFDEAAWKLIQGMAIAAEDSPDCFTATERISIEANYRDWRAKGLGRLILDRTDVTVGRDDQPVVDRNPSANA